MSVSRPNTNTGNQSSTPATPTSIPQQPQQTQQGAPRMQHFNVREQFGSLLPTTNAGEHIKKITDRWRKTIADNELPVKISILDNKTRGGVGTCIVVSMSQQAANGRTMAAAHTIIIEASNGQLPNRTINTPNGVIEIPTVAGDAYTESLWEKVRAEVQGGDKNVDVYDAVASVIPRELSPDDEHRTHMVLMFAVEACYRILQESMGTSTPFCLEAIPKSDRIVAKVDANPQPVETPTGLPIRSDIAIHLSASETSNQNDPFAAPTQDITSIDGYVDLVYAHPPIPVHGMPPVTQHYYPRLVITNIESRLGALTLEIFLLAIHTSTLLGKNLAWANCFLPRISGGDTLRDIGAIGLEMPALTGDPSKPAMIKSSALSNEDFYTLITTAIHPSLSYSIDVEESGCNSWLTGVFTAAAMGDATANRVIINAADNLTNGAFSKCYQGGALVNDDVNRIHLGYYTDQRTLAKRDIRSLDYLGVLNWIGQSDMQQVIEWDSTFTDANLNPDVRLQKRTKLIEKFFTDCKIKGYARRLTFTADFIVALNRAVTMVDRQIQPTNIQFDMGGNQRRGGEAMAGYAVDPRAMAGSFNYASSGGGSSFVGSMQSRWGRR